MSRPSLVSSELDNAWNKRLAEYERRLPSTARRMIDDRLLPHDSMPAMPPNRFKDQNSCETPPLYGIIGDHRQCTIPPVPASSPVPQTTENETAVETANTDRLLRSLSISPNLNESFALKYSASWHPFNGRDSNPDIVPENSKTIVRSSRERPSPAGPLDTHSEQHYPVPNYFSAPMETISTPEFDVSPPLPFNDLSSRAPRDEQDYFSGPTSTSVSSTNPYTYDLTPVRRGSGSSFDSWVAPLHDSRPDLTSDIELTPTAGPHRRTGSQSLQISTNSRLAEIQAQIEALQLERHRLAQLPSYQPVAGVPRQMPKTMNASSLRQRSSLPQLPSLPAKSLNPTFQPLSASELATITRRPSHISVSSLPLNEFRRPLAPQKSTSTLFDDIHEPYFQNFTSRAVPASQNQYVPPMGVAKPTASGHGRSLAVTELSSEMPAPSINHAGHGPEPLNFMNLLQPSSEPPYRQLVYRIVRQGDQQASIFIQQKLKACSSNSPQDIQERNRILDAIIESAPEMMTNRFGNWAFQRCLEDPCTPEEKRKVAKALTGRVVELATNCYGTHVIQKALECEEDVRLLVLGELLLGDPAVTLINKHASHVWSRIMELTWSPPAPPIFVFVNKALKGRWVELATHETGSLVVQHLFENCVEQDTRDCLEEIFVGFRTVVRDQWGSFVIQHMLEHGMEGHRDKALTLLGENLALYAVDSQAMKSIDKALKVCPEKAVAQFVNRLCDLGKTGRRPLVVDLALNVMAGQFICQILPLATIDQKKRLNAAIKKHVVTLKGNKAGSKIVWTFDRMRATDGF